MALATRQLLRLDQPPEYIAAKLVRKMLSAEVYAPT